MESIILELQRDALDRSILVPDLLRKAFLIAHKLNISEFKVWTNRELNGYENVEEVPDYRVVQGIIKAWKPFKGWQPVIFSDEKVQKTLSIKRFLHSISEIETMINRDKKEFIHMPFPPSIGKQLQEAIGFETQVTLMVPISSLVRITDTVRTIILNWSLKLEEDGIIGEGLSFTPLEKEKSKLLSYCINNFYQSILSNHTIDEPIMH